VTHKYMDGLFEDK